MKNIHDACKKNNCKSLFHDDNTKCAFAKGFRSNYIKFWKKFIPYPAIVKQSNVVLFSGSLCLQNVCWLYGCPMLIMPLHTEQYLWAKLYKRYTTVDYIDQKNPPSDFIMFITLDFRFS